MKTKKMFIPKPRKQRLKDAGYHNRRALAVLNRP